MIKSNYITDIINLLFDCDKNGLFATQQIPFLTEENFEFTGSGLFVYFDHNTRIEKFKTDNQNLVLDVVTIKSVEHQIEAQAILFFKNWLIDNLEIWCYEGEYPQKDLKNYILTQTWLNSDNKMIDK